MRVNGIGKTHRGKETAYSASVKNKKLFIPALYSKNKDTVSFGHAKDSKNEETHKYTDIQKAEILKKYGITKEYGKFVWLDDKSFDNFIKLLDNGYSIEDAELICPLEDELHIKRAFELRDKGLRNYCIIRDMAKLNDEQYARAGSLIDFHIESCSAAGIAKLDGKAYERAKELLAKGVDAQHITTISELSDGEYKKATELLASGVKSGCVARIVRLNDAQYSKALSLMSRGIDADCIPELSCLDEYEYTKAIKLINRDVKEEGIADIVKLKGKQYKRAVKLVQRGIDNRTIPMLARLNAKEYKRAIKLLDTGVEPASVCRLSSLDGISFTRALSLVAKNVNPYYIANIAQLDEESYKRACILLDKGISDFSVPAIAKLTGKSYDRALCLIDKKVIPSFVPEITQLKDEKYEKALYLADMQVESYNIARIAELEENDYQKIKAILDKGCNIGRDYSSVLEYDEKTYEKALKLADRKVPPLDLKSILHKKNDVGDEIFDKVIEKLDKGLDGKSAFSLAAILKFLSSGQAPDIEKKIKLNSCFNSIRDSLDNDKIFTKEEQTVLKTLYTSLRHTVTPTEVSKQQIKSMMTGFFANNNPELDETIKSADFVKYGKKGIPLEYPRKNFVSDLNDILSSTDEEKRQKILKKLDITLTDKAGIPGYNGIIDLTNLDKEDETERKVSEIATRFIKENKVKTGDEKLDNALNSLTAGMPEFINVIGKRQHNIQTLTVDTHILEVYKQCLKNPEFETLSGSDKTVLKFTAIMHDIAKEEGIVDEKHPEVSALYARNILEKYPFPVEINDRIFENIKNHHWLTHYNKGLASADSTAALFRNKNDFKTARIMAESDLKGISNEFYEALKPALEASKLLPVETAVDNIAQKGQMIFTSRIIKPELVPEKEYKGHKYRVIDFNNMHPDEDLSKYGFPKGITRENARFLIHAGTSVESFDGVETLTDVANGGFLSVSYVSPEKCRTFCRIKFGLSMEAQNVNIGNASSDDQSSGANKTFDRFSKTITGHDFMSQFREELPTEVKSELGLTDDEYKELYKLISSKKHITQIKDNEVFVLGTKRIKGKKIKAAIQKAEDTLINNVGISRINEVTVYNPKINAFTAKVDSLDEIPDKYLNFVRIHNLPIYLFSEVEEDNELY